MSRGERVQIDTERMKEDYVALPSLVVDIGVFCLFCYLLGNVVKIAQARITFRTVLLALREKTQFAMIRICSIYLQVEQPEEMTQVFSR